MSTSTPQPAPHAGAPSPETPSARTDDGLDVIAGADKRPATVAVVCGFLGFVAPVVAVLGLVAGLIALLRGGPATRRAVLGTAVCVSALLFMGLRFQMGWVW